LDVLVFLEEELPLEIEMGRRVSFQLGNQLLHLHSIVNKLVLVPDFDMFEHPDMAEVTVPDVPDGGDYFIASE